jgi:hypothetical protein
MDDKFVMWVVDVEFATIKSANAIPFSICMRGLKTHEIVLFTNIDFDMSLVELEEEIARHHELHSESENLSPWHRSAYFARFYKSDRTNGMSLRAVGQAMRAAGFDPRTHRILSWYSPIDGVVVRRALCGDDALISYVPSQSLLDAGDDYCIQPFDVSRLTKRCTNLESGACGFAYRSIFRDFKLTMREADSDTLAMHRLYLRLLEESSAWLGTWGV